MANSDHRCLKLMLKFPDLVLVHCKMERWPLPHLPHQENPMAYKTLLFLSLHGPVCSLPGRLLVHATLVTLTSLLFSGLMGFSLLYPLPGPWFLPVAARQTPLPLSSLTFSEASLDQPF